MSHQLTRHAHDDFPRAVAGDGCYVIDANGKRYLDASGGPAVSCLGHSDDVIKAAVIAQLDAIAFPYSGFFTTDAAEQLADKLARMAPGDLDRVYYVSGGSEAIEAAVKLARQYVIEIGQPERTKIIARRQSYHGNTLGALAVGGHQARREFYKPMLTPTSHIAPCYQYRLRHHDEDAVAYGQRAADELEQEIQRLGPENVMAFIAEPVVGAALGAVPAVEGYFPRIREICNQHGVLLILDEVMCGVGRTGHMFACEADQIVPDIVCLAKGLGAGYQPLGAVLCRSGMYQAIADGSGFFQHGHTFQGHPVAAAAGLAVLKTMEDRNLVEQVDAMGQVLQQQLNERLAGHGHVGDIRGRGLFWGVELVANVASKEPFPASAQVAARLKSTAFANGLICYPSAGTADGVNGDHVIIAPPYIISEAEIAEACDLLARSIDVVVDGLA